MCTRARTIPTSFIPSSRHIHWIPLPIQRSIAPQRPARDEPSMVPPAAEEAPPKPSAASSWRERRRALRRKREAEEGDIETGGAGDDGLALLGGEGSEEEAVAPRTRRPPSAPGWSGRPSSWAPARRPRAGTAAPPPPPPSPGGTHPREAQGAAQGPRGAGGGCPPGRIRTRGSGGRRMVLLRTGQPRRRRPQAREARAEQAVTARTTVAAPSPHSSSRPEALKEKRDLLSEAERNALDKKGDEDRILREAFPGPDQRPAGRVRAGAGGGVQGFLPDQLEVPPEAAGPGGGSVGRRQGQVAHSGGGRRHPPPHPVLPGHEVPRPHPGPRWRRKTSAAPPPSRCRACPSPLPAGTWWA